MCSGGQEQSEMENMQSEGVLGDHLAFHLHCVGVKHSDHRME